MVVTTLTVGELQTNCYLVSPDNNSTCVIIDPGDEADFISEEIIRLHLQPTAILLTHGHYDHCLAVPELVLNFSLPVFLHSSDVFLYKRIYASATHWSSAKPLQLALPPTTSLTTLNLPYLHIIPTPGHTPGSVCYLFDQYLFTGDTLFADNIGDTSHQYSQPTALNHSVRQLLRLPPNTLIYPGHGPSAILSELQLLPLTLS